jgi:hypothetical protein
LRHCHYIFIPNLKIRRIRWLPDNYEQIRENAGDSAVQMVRKESRAPEDKESDAQGILLERVRDERGEADEKGQQRPQDD